MAIARSSSAPTTTRSGRMKSSTAAPSLRNSGLETTEKSTRAPRRFNSSSMARRILSAVPTGTVDLVAIQRRRRRRGHKLRDAGEVRNAEHADAPARPALLREPAYEVADVVDLEGSAELVEAFGFSRAAHVEHRVHIAAAGEERGIAALHEAAHRREPDRTQRRGLGGPVVGKGAEGGRVAGPRPRAGEGSPGGRPRPPAGPSRPPRGAL